MANDQDVAMCKCEHLRSDHSNSADRSTCCNGTCSNCCAAGCYCPKFQPAPGPTFTPPADYVLLSSAEHARLKADLASERERAEEAEKALAIECDRRRSRCAYCGEGYPNNDAAVKAHCAACPKHPLSAALKRAEEAERGRDEALKSAGEFRGERNEAERKLALFKQTDHTALAMALEQRDRAVQERDSLKAEAERLKAILDARDPWKDEPETTYGETVGANGIEVKGSPAQASTTVTLGSYSTTLYAGPADKPLVIKAGPKPAPCSRCGAPSDLRFYSPVSKDRCELCARAQIAKPGRFWLWSGVLAGVVAGGVALASMLAFGL